MGKIFIGCIILFIHGCIEKNINTVNALNFDYNIATIVNSNDKAIISDTCDLYEDIDSLQIKVGIKKCRLKDSVYLMLRINNKCTGDVFEMPIRGIGELSDFNVKNKLKKRKTRLFISNNILFICYKSFPGTLFIAINLKEKIFIPFDKKCTLNEIWSDKDILLDTKSNMIKCTFQEKGSRYYTEKKFVIRDDSIFCL